MPAFRVYFLQDRSFLAAVSVEAASYWEARDAVRRQINNYPWAGRLSPDKLEIWDGPTLRLVEPLGPAGAPDTGRVERRTYAMEKTRGAADRA